ncbi:pyrroline-5-carboxylate reductase [Zooshikella ganghwensis]|uniref:Pyrroline-5-carboxylate reductase n=1 Tax=Zooshikella ganghwensis TaxID=202772 RepID=A0A4P9VUQ4_9GAMM|nr:pyrroline-5-carboxylate reductase [Zooshikella ganghwensis]RDH46072.1 pyrroline-5-carboxylate reductase [Zooshikella ganghwensis]
MHKPTLAFIGAGNMAKSIINGLLTNGYSPNLIWATDTRAEALISLESQLNINTSNNNHEAMKHADIVILAVKPQVMSDVLNELSTQPNLDNKLLLSIAAGITTAFIQQHFSIELAITRAMPNTPAMVGCGATGLFANDLVSNQQKAYCESIFNAVGTTCWVDEESTLDAITAISGSGPAYFFLFMEALIDAAIQRGLPPDMAKQLVMQTAAGAALMANTSDQAIATLRKNVTSPGGTTAQALNVFEENNLRLLVDQATAAAQQRAQELSNPE